LLVNGRLQLGLVALRDVDRVANLEREGQRIDSAGAVHCIVRIRRLRGNAASVERVLERMRREAAVAAVVIEVAGAVDKLLL